MVRLARREMKGDGDLIWFSSSRLLMIIISLVVIPFSHSLSR